MRVVRGRLAARPSLEPQGVAGVGSAAARSFLPVQPAAALLSFGGVGAVCGHLSASAASRAVHDSHSALRRSFAAPPSGHLAVSLHRRRGHLATPVIRAMQ